MLSIREIKEGLRTKLKAGEESARLSRMLGTIRTDAPVDLNLEDYRLGEGDRKEALRLKMCIRDRLYHPRLERDGGKIYRQRLYV